MHERGPEAVPLSLVGNGTRKLARGWLAALAGAIAIALTFGALIGFGAGDANAATPGVTTNVTLNGAEYDGVKVVNEGDTVTMKIQYSKDVVAGSTVKIVLGPNVTLKDLPSGNKAIKSVVVDPSDSNAVLITFADEWPADVDQGVLDLTFTVNNVDASSSERINWTVDGAEQGIVNRPGFDAAVFFEKDSNYAQEIPRRSSRPCRTDGPRPAL